MNKKWINTKVVFEWDGEKYVEIYVDGYYYNGALDLCAEDFNAGFGAGGGGGGGGNGGVIVFITSNLSVPLIDNGTILYNVTKGYRGVRGLAGGNVHNGTDAQHGVNGTDGSDGELVQIIM